MPQPQTRTAATEPTPRPKAKRKVEPTVAVKKKGRPKKTTGPMAPFLKSARFGLILNHMHDRF